MLVWEVCRKGDGRDPDGRTCRDDTVEFGVERRNEVGFGDENWSAGEEGWEERRKT